MNESESKDTESKMQEVIKESQEWVKEIFGILGHEKCVHYVSHLIKVIEYQKGSCLVAWAENEQLKKEMGDLKKINKEKN